jgi:hypothetical protein
VSVTTEIVAPVANGSVRVHDWVRELPAKHFQPCYCCLCAPAGGERPIRQVKGIVQRNGKTMLSIPDLGEIDSDEFERVNPPGARARA